MKDTALAIRGDKTNVKKMATVFKEFIIYLWR